MWEFQQAQPCPVAAGDAAKRYSCQPVGTAASHEEGD